MRLPRLLGSKVHLIYVLSLNSAVKSCLQCMYYQLAVRYLLHGKVLQSVSAKSIKRSLIDAEV